VGFRYTVQSIARNLDLKGWIKNLPDGRVEAMVQGRQEQITHLCQQIEDHFEGKIRDRDLEWQTVQKVFEGFEIVV